MTSMEQGPQADPRRLIELLTAADWRQVGGREGQYARFAPPERDDLGPRQRSLLIPLDPVAPDFPELMNEAVLALGRMPRESAASAFVNRLIAMPTDAFSFSKETAAPKGWIQWDAGESLIASARGLLIAGAKTAREARTYYGNRYGRFAHRFLDEVMMGQTEVGSYVVRAYVPVERAIPISTSKQAEEGVHFEGQDVINTREVSRTLVTTLESATDALQHYRALNSFAGFTDPSAGLSYESVLALKVIAEEAEHASITVSWDSTGESHEYEQEFSFTAAEVPVLERAATALVKPEPRRDAVATGVVHLLTRAEAGGPGVIGMTTASGVPAKKLRVHLPADDYARALEAHGAGNMIRVTGVLEREGNNSHLYSASVTAVVEGEHSSITGSRVSQQDDNPLF